MVVRALRRSDADEWQAVRARNHDWLRPWDATVPPGASPRPSTYKLVVRSLLHQAKQGQCLPFVVEVDGRFVGQVTVSNVSRGSAQWASIGYWVAAEVAADIEAGPVVDRRRRIGRSLGVGAGREVGSQCWHGRAESDEGHRCEQKLLHQCCSPEI